MISGGLAMLSEFKIASVTALWEWLEEYWFKFVLDLGK
ncbi:Uncharacterised protein [Yersinia nurmii]|uniref:Uncharacterized protein n=1 Tax=Yersinia nurmii TaxID=685706 RepID=A0ABM9S907_9GAMM|nr:Uncharacterised protein [Yersinia nurmii]